MLNLCSLVSLIYFAALVGLGMRIVFVGVFAYSVLGLV